MRAAWALHELGLDYEAVPLSSDECAGAEHLQRHPLGRVPALELDDGQVLFESTAIVLALADLYPDAGLIGPLGSRLRGEVYEWSIFAMTELERPALVARPGSPVTDQEFVAQNRRATEHALAAIADQVGGHAIPSRRGVDGGRHRRRGRAGRARSRRTR